LLDIIHEAKVVRVAHRLWTCILAEYIHKSSDQQWNANVNKSYSQRTLCEQINTTSINQLKLELSKHQFFNASINTLLMHPFSWRGRV